MDAKRISREHFNALVSANEQQAMAQITELVSLVQRLQAMRCRIAQSEDDGLRVTFYETEDSFFFLAEEKGECGFTHQMKEATDGSPVSSE